GPSKNSILGELSVLVGTWMGSYFLRRVIGVGKTGVVFEAYDEAHERPAAVKVFSQRYISDGERRNRFIQGTRAFCRIRDPHLIQLYQAGKNQASFYFAAMELVQGESLDNLIERIGINGMLEWKEVWRCAYQISTALVTTYRHNVVHRNLVPRNIIRRSEDERYLLGDFSLASPIDPNLQSWTGKDFIGELHYLPPERVPDAQQAINAEEAGLPFGGITDIRSDIFGLGATCYAMLSGKPPASGVAVSDVLTSIRGESPALPTDAQLGVNEQFESIIMKMIAKNPEKRYQTPAVLVKELARIGRLNGLEA
ncbi:MAG: serine/threonine-protein kinase, partial [Planctomycetota bacterium]